MVLLFPLDRLSNPAKVVKMRFDGETIEKLLKIAWWNWDIKKITQNLRVICGLNIEELERIAHE